MTTGTAELATIEAGAQLPRDLAIIKMENDSIMAMAAARPRDYAKVLGDVKAQLATYKSFAQEAIYNKPVGKDVNGRQKFARNLSIRAAEALAEAYGFNRVRTYVEPIDEHTVRVEAVFTDFQSGRIWSDSGILSKLYKARNGKTMRHPDDRFYNVVVKAEASKRIRECILRSIPPGLRSELELCVDEQLDKFLDEKTVEKIVAQFSGKNVTADMIEKMLGKRLTALSQEDRATLLGIWNSINDGETTVEEVFGVNGATSPKSGDQPKTLDDVVAKADPKPIADAVKQVADDATIEPPGMNAEALKALDTKRRKVLGMWDGLKPDQYGAVIKNVEGLDKLTAKETLKKTLDVQLLDAVEETIRGL